MAVKENKYQAQLIKKIKKMYPKAIIMKNDSSYIQGIPDLLILYKNKWASLEVKRSLGAAVRPNQKHYVEQMNQMSFSSFICPENEKEVMDELQRTFRFARNARPAKSK